MLPQGGITLAELQKLPGIDHVSRRIGYRDGWGDAIKIVEEVLTERRMSFEQAMELAWDYWQGDLAAWERKNEDHYIDSPRSPLERPTRKAMGRPASAQPRLRFLVMQRDGFRCRLCGATADDGACLEVDHRVPKAKGGQGTLDNLWTLCHDCNAGKSDLDL